jgi:transcriptional accessory protein Tex/SPT6
LRVPESAEPLDNTDIHPDQYKLAKYILENNSTKVDEKMKELYPEVTQATIDFILNAYQNLGKEKRVNSTHSKANLKSGDVKE